MSTDLISQDPTSTHAATRGAPNLAMAFTHARFLLLEILRVPVAVVSSAVFPALLLLFVVVPFVDDTDPVGVTAAVTQLTVFAVMSSFLFTFGVGVADDREKAWDPFLRTLPAPAWPRIASRLLAGFASAVLAVVPVTVVGALATAAAAPPVRLAAGLLALLVAGLPFLLGGLAIGYSLPVKAALPVTQLVFFPMALGGGLFLPPEIFPGWLQAVSTVLPSRGARDLVVSAVVGTPVNGVTQAALVGWIVLTGVLALGAYRRDEGRRYR